MNCLVAVINAFVLFSTGMPITAFDFRVPVNIVCAIMRCSEIDIENFSAVINHVQLEKKLAGFEHKLLASRDKF